MALPDSVSGGGADVLSDSMVLVIACTPYPDRYASMASDRFLLLSFDDITNPKHLYSFKPEHDREIRRFVGNALDDSAGVERIIAACDGGVSR